MAKLSTSYELPWLLYHQEYKSVFLIKEEVEVFKKKKKKFVLWKEATFTVYISWIPK